MYISLSIYIYIYIYISISIYIYIERERDTYVYGLRPFTLITKRLQVIVDCGELEVDEKDNEKAARP